MELEFFLIQDNDCHWYIVPLARREDWYDWVDSEDADLGIVPEWVSLVDGSPSRIMFKKWRSED